MKPIAREVESFINIEIYNAVGKFTLRQSAFLIKKSRLLLTNDSAPNASWLWQPEPLW